jgi:hypothetical protein
MATEKGLEGGKLIPTDEEIGRRVPKEATNVGCGLDELYNRLSTSDKRQTSDREREKHRDARSKVTPRREIVARPDRSVALRSSKKGT